MIKKKRNTLSNRERIEFVTKLYAKRDIVGVVKGMDITNEQVQATRKEDNDFDFVMQCYGYANAQADNYIARLCNKIKIKA